MQRQLFSYLFILISCLCPYLNLHNFVTSAVVDDSSPPLSCDAASQSLLCANLGDISYPFGDAEPCAGSDSFRIDCSNSSQAYWEALRSDDDELGAPAVMGIFQRNHLNFINLTWNMQFYNTGHACEALPANTVATYVPKSIHLTSIVANGSLLLSNYNHILLLNCSSLPASVDSKTCLEYEEQCHGLGLQNTPCMQIEVPTPDLMLHQKLSNYSCSHFQFLVAAEDSTSISSWKQGLIQLFYGDVRCETCYASGGTCIYDNTAHTYQKCYHSCKGLMCGTAAKIIIGVGGTVIATAVTTIGIVVLIYRKKTRRSFTKLLPVNLTARSTIISHLDLDGLTERPIEYQYASIVLATEAFSNLLGEGGFGAVYKGTLGNATDDVPMQIAVKVLEARSKHSKKQFLNEVASIGRIHHVHVVRLLGFCIEESHEMLVYEYVINGSLDKWLFHHHSGTQNRVLLWEQRYAIAIGIARGLSYLHEECRHRIVHCDIKPQNILLDEQMHPKIADFGLARLMGKEESRVTTLARGTPGYMGPEFWLGGESQLSTKFDVYSYGMVLLELISGRRNFGQGVCFPEMASEAAMKGSLESIMDGKLCIVKTTDGECMVLDGMQRQQVQTALLVALWCIQDHPMNRPSMSEVVQYLEGIAAINEQPPRPTIASFIISNSAQQLLNLSSDIHYDITQISGGR